MNLLKLIGLTLVQWGKLALAVPKMIMRALAESRHLEERKKAEAERLDRLRNPSKYLEQNSATP